MIDRIETWAIQLTPFSKGWLEAHGWARLENTPDEATFIVGEGFTRSNGTVMARLYERLTKANRRRKGEAIVAHMGGYSLEDAYRQGVYDAYRALQEELS